MTVRTTVLQMAPPRGGRAERFAEADALLRTSGPSDLIVFPEMWVTGYFNFDRYEVEAESLDGEIVDFVRDVARARNAYVMGGSFVERSVAGSLHNTAFLVDPSGDVSLTYRKMHVFGYQSREAELLEPGDDLTVAHTDLGVIGVSTCYDLRFPELFRVHTDLGAELLVVPAAWPAARRDHWKLFTTARAVENQCLLVACNQAGTDSGVDLAGTSRICDPWGRLLDEARGHEQVLEAAIDVAQVREVRREFPALADRVLHVEPPRGSTS